MFEKDKTAVDAMGAPMYVAGRKVVKMREFLISGDKSFTAFQPFEMTR
jgi:hypothetical protein